MSYNNKEELIEDPIFSKALKTIDFSKALTGRGMPSVFIDGKEWKIGIGNVHGCSISADEMDRNINKICINRDLEYYYAVPKEYYLKIRNREFFSWIGEWVSKQTNKDSYIKFGFRNYASGLTRYKMPEL